MHQREFLRAWQRAETRFGTYLQRTCAFSATSADGAKRTWGPRRDFTELSLGLSSERSETSQLTTWKSWRSRSVWKPGGYSGRSTLGELFRALGGHLARGLETLPAWRRGIMEFARDWSLPARTRRPLHSFSHLRFQSAPAVEPTAVFQLRNGRSPAPCPPALQKRRLAGGLLRTNARRERRWVNHNGRRSCASPPARTDRRQLSRPLL